MGVITAFYNQIDIYRNSTQCVQNQTEQLV